MDLTVIVAILGVIGVLGLSLKDKFSMFKLRSKAKDEQISVVDEIHKVNKDIKQKEEEIKKLEVKAEKAEEIIKTIKENSDKKVEEILKEKDIKKLIKEFDEW